jgi:D-threonate/D-erythronate kinase
VSRATTNLGVIADDFTGALDAGVEFVRVGLEATLCIQPEHNQSAAVQVINIDSREMETATAQQRAMQAAEQLRGRRIFKKIDSTMRGHIGPEIAAILGVGQIQKAVVCPAVIEAGRTVRDGKLLVNGMLLHETDFAGDPIWPASTADMAQLVGRPVTHVPLAMVHRGAAVLAHAIASASSQIITVDACTHADLATIGEAIAISNSLACGALGLARAWASQFMSAPASALAPVPASQQRPVLVVAGSRHPKTIAQVNNLVAERLATAIEITVGGLEQLKQAWISSMEAALSAGQSIVIRPSAQEIWQAGEQRSLIEQLGALAVHVCQEVALGGLVLTGGETASAVCRRLGAMAVQIAGEVEVGVPWGRLVGGSAAGLPLVTKAGGFGHANVLSRAVTSLYNRPIHTSL